MRLALKNLAKIRIGYQLRGRLHHDPAGTRRIIQMRDVQENGLVSADDLTSFTPKRDADQYIVGPRDILVLARGNRNRAFVAENLPDTTVASNHFFIVTPDAARLRPAYLAWYLNCRPVQSTLQASAQGTTVMLVRRSAFGEIEIEVPPLDVQDTVLKLAELREKQRGLVNQLEVKRDALIEAACLDAVSTANRKG